MLETDEYSGLCHLCEQERYRDQASMRGLLKGSDSCHALILRGAEESFIDGLVHCLALG